MPALFWSRIGLYVAAAGAILTALLTFGWSQRRAGAAAECARQTEQTLKAVEARNEVDARVGRVGNAELERMRGKWTRR